MRKILIPLLLLSPPALAEPYTYAPDHCEFQITFPEKPFIETKCAKAGTDCAEVASYTKAVGTDASTNFRVTCNALSAKDVENYTTDIIKVTLEKLITSNALIPYDTQTDDKDGYKTASSVSLSERNGNPLIYNGQIWVGKKSMFTIEAELMGKGIDEVEKTFAEILKSAYPKDKPPAVEKKTH